MKILCLVLPFYILLLAARPCCAGDSCLNEVRSEKQLPSKSGQEKGCPGCSPFFTCGSCSGFIVAVPSVLRDLPLQVCISAFIVYRQPFLREVLRSIWQPPELSEYILRSL